MTNGLFGNQKEQDGIISISTTFKGNSFARLTEGEFPVERVIVVDEADDWVYFTAHGDKRHPYRSQLYRVSLDGGKRERLAEDVGQHNLIGFTPNSRRIQFSPSKKHFVAVRSSPSQPSIAELRRRNGELVTELSSVNQDDVKRLQWSPPEEFRFKAADGVTELHGIMFKPYDFDPQKKYPVIDAIYGGEHIGLMELFASFDQHVALGVPARALAQLGINADLYVKLQQVLKKRGRSTSDLEAVLHRVNQGAGLTGLGLTAEALQAMTPEQILQTMVFAVQSSSSGVEFVRRSPNGRWTLTFRDHNLWLKSAGEPNEVQLTHDGSERLVYDVDNMQESVICLGKA